MIRTIIIPIILLVSYTGFAQSQYKKVFEAEINGSAFFDSRRHFYHNGNEGIYKEIKLSYGLNQFFELGLLGGHQYRSYGYFKKINNDFVILFIDRDYMPIGINIRLNLTDFFVHELKWIKQKERWKVYTQVIPTVLLVSDKRDPRDDGKDILYLYPYVQPNGKKYLGFMSGIKYFVSKHLGFAIEGGDGAIATLQIGATLRW